MLKEVENSAILKKRKSAFRLPSFEYIYMFVMVIYMAQINDTTARMIFGLSGNPVPFLIPIVLTAILLFRHPVSFKNRKLWILLGVFALWSVLVLASVGELTNTSNVSYVFFVFYPIIIAYVQIKVFGRRLFSLYEKIMVLMCKIALPMWLLNILLLNVFEPSFLPKTALGYNVLFLYNWVSPHNGLDDMVLLTLRNPGFSWEPGRFAIMLTPAIFFNLSRRGVKFMGNGNVIWLLAALLSTQSTTGFLIGIVLYSIFLLKLSLKNIAVFFLVLIPVVIGLMNLDFMYDKIVEQLDVKSYLSTRVLQMKYNDEHMAEGEYLTSVSRFESMFFEFLNLSEKPLLGYSTNDSYSFFFENISTNYSLANGLIKILAQFGLPLGILIYSFLFKSSEVIASLFKYRKPYAFFIISLMALISYSFWRTPVFTAFWLFGVFYDRRKHMKKLKNERI